MHQGLSIGIPKKVIQLANHGAGLSTHRTHGNPLSQALGLCPRGETNPFWIGLFWNKSEPEEIGSYQIKLDPESLQYRSGFDGLSSPGEYVFHPRGKWIKWSHEDDRVYATLLQSKMVLYGARKDS